MSDRRNQELKRQLGTENLEPVNGYYMNPWRCAIRIILNFSRNAENRVKLGGLAAELQINIQNLLKYNSRVIQNQGNFT
ncbi:hypothetical protein L0128_14310 [candidate division KSB1 bacterium]|nr:hypothetical protein [candidate division KSB1 bacterium]